MLTLDKIYHASFTLKKYVRPTDLIHAPKICPDSDIYLKTEKTIDLSAIKEFFNDKLSRYKHPHYVTCLKEFPVLANGKVDRKKLFEMANS